MSWARKQDRQLRRHGWARWISGWAGWCLVQGDRFFTYTYHSHRDLFYVENAQLAQELESYLTELEARK